MTRELPVQQNFGQVQDTRRVAPRGEAGDEIDLLQIGRTLWRGKLWILAAVLLSSAVGMHSVMTTAPTYTAETEMALQVQAAPVMDLQSVVQGFSGDAASINTEMSTITSGELIGRLVDRLNLVDDPEFNPYLNSEADRPGPVAAVAGWVRGGLASLWGKQPTAAPPPDAERQRADTVDAVREAIGTASGRDTYVFSISALSHEPQKAVLLSNTLAQLYRDDQIRAKVETTERMATWLSDRVKELRGELDTQQSRISDLKARTGLVSAESLSALNTQAIQIGEQLRGVQADLAQTEARLSELQGVRSASDPIAAAMQSSDAQFASFAAGLANGGAAARERFERRLDQLLLQTQAERDRGIQQVESLQQSVGQLTQQFETQSADFQQLQQLQQEADATQVLYETFLTRLRETTVQESVHQADSRILTSATEAIQVAPRPARALVVAIFLGALVGAAWVLGREFLQNTFRTSEDLERATGRPVLGQIPVIPSKRRDQVIEYLRSKPTSAAAEAVRNLRTSLLLSDVDQPPRVIMMTSSVPSEGKTTISISLAQNLTGLGKRVLLMEGDIRRRTFTNYFPTVESGKGMLAAVSGQVPLSEAIVRSEEIGADILLGDRSTVNAADLFSSAAFARLIEEARSTYDYVVIDTPPVLVVPDARVIAQHSDAVVYVVHWDHTSKTQVEEGERLFRSVNIPVTGFVLSRVDPKGMRRYGYGGSYGAYARYGDGYYTS